MPESFYLHAPALGDFKPAITLGQGLPTSIPVKVGDETKEYPVSYLWKDVLIGGSYRKHATGQALTLDHPGLQRMARTVKQMIANGVNVPVTVDHRDDADATRGDVLDAEVRPDGKLYLLHRIIGEDNTRTALANKVSVYIEPEFTDPKGNKYADAIRHSTLTQHPVITGQDDFQPIAASQGRRHEAPIYLHAGPININRSPDMEWIKQLRDKLGVAADVPDDKLPEHVATLKSKADGVALSEQQHTALQAEVATLKAVEADLERQLDAATTKTPPDPIMLSMVASSIEVQRDAAIKAGGVSPAIAKEIDALLIQDAKPTGLALSLIAGHPHPIGVTLYKILAGNKPVALGEQSGVQEHGRQIPGATNGDEAAKAAETAGQQQGKSWQDQQLAARGLK